MNKVQQELRYDGATISDVHEMLGDEAFRAKVCDAQGVLRHTIAVERNGEAMAVTVDQVQPAQGIPGFARKFVGDEINVVQTEDWLAPAKGNITVTIPGKPGEMSGTALLTEDPDGTTETVTLSIKVNIPLVGGKIEGLIGDLLTKALRAEHRTGQKWLAGER